MIDVESDLAPGSDSLTAKSNALQSAIQPAVISVRPVSCQSFEKPCLKVARRPLPEYTARASWTAQSKSVDTDQRLLDTRTPTTQVSPMTWNAFQHRLQNNADPSCGPKLRELTSVAIRWTMACAALLEGDPPVAEISGYRFVATAQQPGSMFHAMLAENTDRYVLALHGLHMGNWFLATSSNLVKSKCLLDDIPRLEELVSSVFPNLPRSNDPRERHLFRADHFCLCPPSLHDGSQGPCMLRGALISYLSMEAHLFHLIIQHALDGIMTGKELLLTGHSMGGTIAILFALRFHLFWRHHFGKEAAPPRLQIITFGTPQFANEAMMERIAEELAMTDPWRMLHFGNPDDPVYLGRLGKWPILHESVYRRAPGTHVLTRQGASMSKAWLRDPLVAHRLRAYAFRLLLGQQ